MKFIRVDKNNRVTGIISNPTWDANNLPAGIYPYEAEKFAGKQFNFALYNPANKSVTFDATCVEMQKKMAEQAAKQMEEEMAAEEATSAEPAS